MKKKKSAIYVDENRNIFQGEEAKKKLDEKNDFEFAHMETGVTKVSHERWEQAQKYEEACWFESLNAADDRNFFHYLAFDKYHNLVGKQFEHAIELGCGPFTNLRIISKVANVTKIDLEDPLIHKYLSHPNVRYSNSLLRNGDFALDPFFVKSIRKVCRLFSHRLANKITVSRKIKVDKLYNCGIEEMPINRKYDLIVIVNVIEHCQDVERIFDVIKMISKPGTILVFADKKYDGKEVYELLKSEYFEAGHPLMVDFSIISDFLKSNFATLFERTIVEKGEEEDLGLEFETYYFIGQKL